MLNPSDWSLSIIQPLISVFSFIRRILQGNQRWPGRHGAFHRHRENWSAADAKHAEQRHLAVAGRYSFTFPPLSAETLGEDLSPHKVDRFLCAQPAMTTACMLLSFGGHQLYCYRCSLVQGVPERVPGPAGVTEGGGEVVLSNLRSAVISL